MLISLCHAFINERNIAPETRQKLCELLAKYPPRNARLFAHALKVYRDRKQGGHWRCYYCERQQHNSANHYCPHTVHNQPNFCLRCLLGEVS